MTKKITPQEVFQSMLDAYDVIDPRQRTRLPQTWEEVSDHDKALFVTMAFKTNCIVGEMCVDPRDEGRTAA